MSNLSYAEEQEIKKSMGLIPKNPPAQQPKKTFHLDEAKRYKAEAESAFVAAELAKSKGQINEERHYRMLRQSALEKEQREREIATPKQGIYRDPGHGPTQFIGMEVEEGYDNTRSRIQGWLDSENIQIENSIRNMKLNQKWDYKRGTAIHGPSYWDPQKLEVVHVAPKVILTLEQVTERLLEAEKQIAALKSSNEVKKSRPKNKVSPKK